jgi:hypothetical protein
MVSHGRLGSMLEDTYSWVLHGGLAMVSGGGDLRSEGLSEMFFLFVYMCKRAADVTEFG